MEKMDKTFHLLPQNFGIQSFYIQHPLYNSKTLGILVAAFGYTGIFNSHTNITTSVSGESNIKPGFATLDVITFIIMALIIIAFIWVSYRIKWYDKAVTDDRENYQLQFIKASIKAIKPCKGGKALELLPNERPSGFSRRILVPISEKDHWKEEEVIFLMVGTSSGMLFNCFHFDDIRQFMEPGNLMHRLWIALDPHDLD